MRRGILLSMAGLFLWVATVPTQAQSVSDPFYDLNTYNLLTPVKSQGNLGTCWAFADVTAFQSAMLKAGLAASPLDPALDISTWHLATANGNITDLVPSISAESGELEYNGWGGFNDYAVGYWTRGRGQWVLPPTAATTPAGGGPVTLSSNPLNVYPLAAASRLENLTPFVAPASQAQAPVMLSGSVDFEWNGLVADLAAFQETLKQALLDYGALAVAVNATIPESNPDDVFFSSDPGASSNHAVALVGWDDAYSVTIDSTTYTGAWIIQNSWGRSGGEDPVTGDLGYYFVPYADISKANVKEANAFVVRSREYSPGVFFAPSVVQTQIFAPYAANNQGNFLTQVGSDAGTLSLAVSRQDIPSNSLLGAFALVQTSPGTEIELSIYTGFGPTGPTGAPIYTQGPTTLNSDGTGYNMVDFTAPIRIEEGGDFYFQVDFGNTFKTPIAIDTRTVALLPGPGGSHRGLSWYSDDGTVWTDLLEVPDEQFGSGIFFFKVFRLAEDLNNPTINPLFDFTVDGELQAGSAGAAPSILGLRFRDGGVLTLQQDLTVTGGNFHVEDGYATGSVDGGSDLLTPGNAQKSGAGRLSLEVPLTVGGGLSVVAGTLDLRAGATVAGSFTQSGSASQTNIVSGTALNVSGGANVQGGGVSVAGRLGLGGPLEITGGAVSVPVGGSVQAASLLLGAGSFLLEGTAAFAGAVNVSGGLLTLRGGSLTAGSFVMGGGTTDFLTSLNNAGPLSLAGSAVANFYNGVTVSASSLALRGGQAVLFPGSRVVTTGGTTIAAGTLNVQSGAAFQSGGDTQVSGTLIANGTVTSPNVVVTPGGLLTGAGTILSNVANSGTVSPGNSPGTLTIQGQFTQAPNGTLLMEVTDSTVYDRLIVTGPAALAGTLQIQPTAGIPLSFGETFDGLLQASVFTGRFDTIAMPAGFRGRLVPDGSQLDLLVAPASYTQVAVTPNQAAVASALDAYIPAVSGDRLEVSTALDRLTAPEYPNAFEAIGPAFYQSLPVLALEQAVAFGQQMQSRWRAVQLGVEGFQSINIETSPIQSPSAVDAKSGPAKGVAPIESPTRWATWVQGNGLFSDTAGINGLPGYRSEGGGVTVGADYRWSDAFATGVFSAYQGAFVEYDGGGSTTSNGVRFGAYTAYGKQTGFFANSLIGAGYTGYQVKRPISFGDLNRTAKSDPQGWDLEVLLNTGYNWELGPWNLGLTASAQYTYSTVQSFTENGAQSLDLAVGRQELNSLRSFLGGQVAYLWNVTPSVRIVPQAILLWQHEFLEVSDTFGAALDGGDGPGFAFTSTAPGRDAMLATVGLSAELGDRWNANAFYTANFGRNDFVSHMISGGLQWEF